MLLDPDLLELNEFGPSGLQGKTTSGSIDPALFAGAFGKRHEGQRFHLKISQILDKKFQQNCKYTHWLVSFSAALVAGVGAHHQNWLDLSAAGDNTTDSQQRANVLSPHLADGNRLGRSQIADKNLTVKKIHIN